MSTKKILVIGATGAQGLAVVDGLLKPGADGTPSPYSVRALTRDPNNARAQTLSSRGVEVVKGSIEDLPSVTAALQGVYGAFVNTDSFTVGEMKETFLGMRIFGLAKQAGTLRHYIWSGLDNPLTLSNYEPQYYVEHHTAKAHVILNTAPYMDMLTTPMYGPLNVRQNGTYVFASPIGNAHVPMVALADIGFFARYLFDHRADFSAKELDIASEWVNWPTVVATFTRVTGKPAVYLPLTTDAWMDLFHDTHYPVAGERAAGDNSTTWLQNFTCWWAMYKAELIQRDFDALRRLNPNLYTLERWMRETKYSGDIMAMPTLLKDAENRYVTGGPRANLEAIALL